MSKPLLAAAAMIRNAVTGFFGPQQSPAYVACPVSATTALGAAGALGDVLNFVTLTPLTLSPGQVSIQDGANAAIVIFEGGSDSVGSLVPFAVPCGGTSTNGGWSVITGANVTAIASGAFA